VPALQVGQLGDAATTPAVVITPASPQAEQVLQAGA
jgi:hypothetical protein